MADLLRSDALDVPHGFSTRSGAAADDVLPGAPLVLARQVHSPDVVTVDSPWARDSAPIADALVTARPGIVLGIVTADCAPVLLCDREAGVIGAAHAGWRGAKGGVLANTVAAMEALGARAGRMAAAIGPCIAQPNYEVDTAFRAGFPEEDGRFFAPGREGHFQFDLPGYVARLLQDAGVATVDRLALDTYAGEDCFFSYRRATHRGEETGGRQTSVIGMHQTG